MRLHPNLIDALRQHMPWHGDWHTARLPRHWLPVVDRPGWDVARGHYPNLKYVTEAGSGAEFLTFHREMIRHFKWIVENTLNHNYNYVPWSDLPDFLKSGPNSPGGLAESYLSEWRRRVDLMIQDPQSTVDQLGNFLESTKLDASWGSNIHNLCHGIIAGIEYRGPSGYEGAEMDDFDTAHFNHFFWELHGWLDDIYARWQVTHGESVDQSPMDPSGGHGGHGHDHHADEHTHDTSDTGVVIR